MTTPRGNPRVAPMAYYTAQPWIREGYPESHRFDSRLARFAFRTVGALSRFPLLPRGAAYFNDAIHLRHVAFERFALAEDPDYLVDVGAGLSPRGLQIARTRPGTVVVDADLPHVVEAKRRAYLDLALPANFHLHALDLLDPACFDELPVPPRPSHRLVVLTEGVMDYLSHAEKAAAWSSIRSLLARAGERSSYYLEVNLAERLLPSPLLRRTVLALFGAFVDTRFEDRLFASVDQAVRALHEAGFREAEVVDLALQEWPSPSPPLDVVSWRLLRCR